MKVDRAKNAVKDLLDQHLRKPLQAALSATTGDVLQSDEHQIRAATSQSFTPSQDLARLSLDEP